MLLGTRIRALRRQQRLTLQALADAAGYSKSLLSRIESNKVMPTVASLTRIAQSLKVPIAVLLDASAEEQIIYTPAEQTERAAMTLTEKGYAFCALANARLKKRMMPFVFEARRGEVISEELSHDGEEFIYVLDGEMRYRVADRLFVLRPGDSLYFDGINGHELEPLSDVVRYLAFFALSEDSFEVLGDANSGS